MFRERVFLYGKRIDIVGTIHVSKESVDVVRKTIEEVNPEIVAVELDMKRYEVLANEKKWSETEISEIIRKGKGNLFLVNLLLTNFQRKIGDKLGTRPGSEFRKAIEIAREKNIPIALVDRDIEITLKRAFRKMSFFEKLKFFTFLGLGFFDSEIGVETFEELKERDLITELLKELSREIPSIKSVLIDERDEYIAERLKSLDEREIVAVLGAGHLDGVKKKLKSPTKKIEELEKIPKKRNFFKYLVPLLFFSIIFYGFYSRGAEITIEMLKWWFLINGTLSALGVLLAFGHPFSILTAFLVAPITSLNPALASGWFAGVVEAYLRKPKVKDIESLGNLNSFKEYWKNSVTRILLVIAFANLGSVVGTFWALPYMLRILG